MVVMDILGFLIFCWGLVGVVIDGWKWGVDFNVKCKVDGEVSEGLGYVIILVVL